MRKPGDPESVEDPGMSLRDWFAGQALSGLLANVDVTRNSRDVKTGSESILPVHALGISAYYLADAMLAEREK